MSPNHSIAGQAHLWQEGLRGYANPSQGLDRPIIPQEGLKMKSIFEQNGGTYIQAGDYLIPNISLPDAPAYPIGKYGRMREAYLKEHRPGLYTRLILSGKVHEHLAEVERTCKARLDTMIPQMAKAQGVTEAMKARDQLGWVGRMNEIKHSAEESILTEIVYE